MILHTSIWNQKSICVWIASVCKIILALRDLKVCRPSVLIHQTVRGAAFPARLYIYKFEIEGACCQLVLRDSPFAVTVRCTSPLRHKHGNMCPIYCTDAVPEIGVEVIITQDEVGQTQVLSWKPHVCAIELWWYKHIKYAMNTSKNW